MTDISKISEIFNEVHENINKYFFGPREIPVLMSSALLAQGHILLEGVPGVAKTTLAKFYSALTGCTFKRIQFTPDLMPTDITGTVVPSADFQSSRFIPGPVFTQVLLGDEINRSPAKTQAALLEALEEKTVTVEGNTFSLEKPFFVIATQNPQELAGTFPLPEAAVDRFIIRIKLSYPDTEQEFQMMKKHQIEPPLPQPLLESKSIVEYQNIINNVTISESLMRYILSIIRWTRRHPQTELGASPRAGIALIRATKAIAALYGRDYGTPDDVKFLAPYVLSHRLRLSYEAEMAGISSSSIIDNALEKLNLLA
ncbi:MAG: MoxR family ATPase [Deltaproteobacteria bacterium]|nr:MoxR family ATPase [Deltaproteobacteria bacterium]